MESAERRGLRRRAIATAAVRGRSAQERENDARASRARVRRHAQPPRRRRSREVAGHGGASAGRPDRRPGTRGRGRRTVRPPAARHPSRRELSALHGRTRTPGAAVPLALALLVVPAQTRPGPALPHHSGAARPVHGPVPLGEPAPAHTRAQRLFGFPDEFEFTGSRNSVQSQIGNSVPPPDLSRAVMATLFGNRAEER
ncbi:DNA cytosine methyltransferase [Amycolatopsis rubida]|uniref:DNA cytosine methyltransferase n=1 Tax=Amycolatopsis rubida TaxID=112413 RepID=UPI003CC7A60A